MRPESCRFPSDRRLNLEAHIEGMRVPAQGADAIADMVGHTVAGRTDYAMSPILIALPHVREHRLVPLGVSTARRSRLLPEVPTLAEAGAMGYDFPIWYGLWAPAGTPVGVVNELSDDIALVLAEPSLPGVGRRRLGAERRLALTPGLGRRSWGIPSPPSCGFVSI